MKKLVKWAMAALLGALLIGQFFSPPLVNPPAPPGQDLIAVDAPPPEIAAIFHRTCYDCHSDATSWPWYSHIWPASAILASHVNQARDDLNFSEWTSDDPHTLNLMAHMVQSGRMPLPSYAWLHPDARLSDAQRQSLVNWMTNAVAHPKN